MSIVDIITGGAVAIMLFAFSIIAVCLFFTLKEKISAFYERVRNKRFLIKYRTGFSSWTSTNKKGEIEEEFLAGIQKQIFIKARNEYEAVKKLFKFLRQVDNIVVESCDEISII